MRLPSVSNLVNQAKSTLFRFPLTLISAICGSVLSMYIFENESDIDNLYPYINALLCFALGIPLFFCIKVLSEKEELDITIELVLNVVGVVMVALLHWSLPSQEGVENIKAPYIKYAIYNIVLHLMVAYVPYWKDSSYNGFWQYNKTLFLRLCLSLLYSAFLYIGIVLALLAIDGLFDIDIDDDIFMDLYIVVQGIFNTWFFLAGTPTDYEALEQDENHPKGLKVFSQFILLPLLVIYLMILYSYTGKVIISWDWPRGSVSYLVSGVASLGIFTLLIVYPYGKMKENKWLGVFSKTYYYLLIPLIVVLFLAIGFRVIDYGVTIKRYAVLTLGLWLTFISLYFIFKGKNIKIVPISLSCLLLVISFGYWGIFSVSERSQVNRLEHILLTTNILEENKIQNEVEVFWDSTKLQFVDVQYPNDKLIIDSVHNEIYSIVQYLHTYHSLEEPERWLMQDLSLLRGDTKFSRNRSALFLRAAGLEPGYIWTENSRYYYFYSERDSKSVTSLKGYDYMIEVNYYQYNQMDSQPVREVMILEGNEFELLESNAYVTVVVNRKDSFNFKLESLTKKLLDTANIEAKHSMEFSLEELTIMGDNCKAQFETIDLQKNREDSVMLGHYNGNIFINVDD